MGLARRIAGDCSTTPTNARGIADRETVRCLQHRSGIEAQVRLPGHQRVADKPRVFSQVWNDGHPWQKHGIEADRAIQRRFLDTKTYLGLEPLPASINEADQGNRSLTGASGKLDQIVECRFWRRVKNPVAAQGCKPVTLRPGRLHFVVHHETLTAATTRENVLRVLAFKRSR